MENNSESNAPFAENRSPLFAEDISRIFNNQTLAEQNRFDSETNYETLKIIDNKIWLKVIVRLKDNSNISDVLSTLSNEDIQVSGNLSNGFGALLSQKGFNKLIQNEKASKIIWPKTGVKFNLDESAPLINATVVWNTFGLNGSEVKVCVIDSGVDTDHPDLSGKIVNEKCYCCDTPPNCGDSDYGCCPDGTAQDDSAEDGYGHGTHVVGIIASQNTTYHGISYGADIYVVRVGDSYGGFGENVWLDIGHAMDWCKDRGVNIISLSFGDNENHPGDSSCPDYIDTEIDNAFGHNISVIIASGNNGYTTGISYPACSPNAISVGATTKNDEMWEDTNKASNLDLFAPGSTITSTQMGGGFVSDSGTSMAAPHVAGAAALLLQEDSSLTPDEIRDVLQYTGVDVYDDETGLTFKRIDVLAAINLLNSATLCYQESANVSTACGGLNTGKYADSGNWDSGSGNVLRTYDKDWSTWGYPSGTAVSYLNINYTKPSGALSSSFLKIKDSVANTRNIGILQSCWDYNATTLMLRSEVRRNVPGGIYGVNWSCYNGANWVFLNNGDGDSLLYEEGIYWVIPTSLIQCYQESANVSTACGGLNTGKYADSGNWDSGAGNVAKTYDQTWSTWGYPSGTAISYLGINYTKPSGALSTSILKVKDSVANTRNVSILQSCWNYNSTTLMFKAEVRRNVPTGVYGVNWSCYNGTTWAFLSNGNDDSLLYEDGMWWNINS